MGLASTFFYTGTMLVFIKVLYSNLDTFASYNENQMLLLVFFNQMNFYLSYYWSVNNINKLIESVRLGELDLILTKPLPHLFFITTRSLSFVNFVKEGLPNLLLILIIIDWTGLISVPIRVLPAILIVVLGQISLHCFRFLFALLTFFTGHSVQVVRLSNQISDNQEIPYEGYSKGLKLFFTSIVPSLFVSGVAVSVLLGKSSSVLMSAYCILITAVFVFLANWGWRIALRNYSSASS